jgi:hypothetical protein
MNIHARVEPVERECSTLLVSHSETDEEALKSEKLLSSLRSRRCVSLYVNTYKTVKSLSVDSTR